MAVQIGGKSIVIAPGDGVLLDLASSYRVDLRDDYRLIGVVMPRDLFGGGVDRLMPVNGLKLAHDNAAVPLLRSMIEVLLQQAPHLPETLAKAAGRVIAELIGASFVAPDAAPLGQSAESVVTLASLRRYIDRHAAEPDLGPERLCATFGLSRTALYRLFKTAGGIAETIRRRRAALALHMLRAPQDEGRSIADIARASGFADSRSLRRALLDIYDMAPNVLRDMPPDEATIWMEHAVAISALFDQT